MALNSVTVTETLLTLPTWREPSAEEMPMFAENRNHQGTTGNPYPNRVVTDVDRVHREDRAYRCIRLENEYLKLEILPELGGKIYSALDKRTGYDFFYKQHVIKPALIGFLGSWVSGGCEFNWPCHHRPSTFMPVDYSIEQGDDGSVTVWLSENEPLDRTKGMVGVRLAPGAAVFDTLVRLYNRTPLRHSFLWWENAAVPVHEQYRLFFPPDVHYVRFHYRKDATSFPIASGEYNGIRMPSPTDISYHKNTQRATSYFAAASKYDFFGGYDERAQCGVVHIADHRVSQGKKMFTWGYGKMEKSWENALTDADGMYAELMAGSYTTDQPDFNWLQPYESKEFTQSWYPIGEMGIPTFASYDAAVRLDGRELWLEATRTLTDAVLELNGRPATRLDLEAGKTFRFGSPEKITSVRLLEKGRELLDYVPIEEGDTELPDPLPGMPTLDELETAQDFYLAGVHAEQYRDPAIRGEAYYRAGLLKYPHDAALLHGLTRALYARGLYAEALEQGLAAWKELTRWNYRPESGDLPYTLGLICEALGREGEALDWHARASWQQDSAARAFTRMALLCLRREDAKHALLYAEKAGETVETAVFARCAALRRLGREDEAQSWLKALLTKDPLFAPAAFLRGDDGTAVRLSDAAQSALDLAEDLLDAGEAQKAREMLAALPHPTRLTAAVCEYLGGPAADLAALPLGIAYPSRELERRALEVHLEKSPQDAVALGLLGCWYYSKRQYEKADSLFTGAIAADPLDWLARRNHAVFLYTYGEKRQEALLELQKAQALNPEEPRLLWETVYVMTRLGRPAEERIALIDRFADICPNDVWLLRAQAYNEEGEYEEALNTLLARQFIPCEGGENAVTGQYMFAQFALGCRAMTKGDWQTAARHFSEGKQLPASLGAGLWNDVLLVPFEMGEAIVAEQLGDMALADRLFDEILARHPDGNLPLLRVYQARILLHRGQSARATSLLREFANEAAMNAQHTDAGWYGSTPFFLSYLEPADHMRQAQSEWLRAVAAEALGEKQTARRLTRASLAKDPENLYARLMLRWMEDNG